MYKRLLYIFSLAFVLTSFLQPAQAAPDINIDEDVAEEPAKATAYRYWIDDNTKRQKHLSMARTLRATSTYHP